LKFYPDLVAAKFDVECVQSASGWTGGIADAASDSECAVVAGAKIQVAFLEKIDVASGVRTDSVQGLDFVAGPSEVNRADRDLRKFIPGIDAVSEDSEFARDAIVGKRFESSDSDCRAGAGFSTEWIQKDLQACRDRDNAKQNAYNSGEKAFKETTPADWRRRIARIVHTQMRR
jgi:hypothetical protein